MYDIRIFTVVFNNAIHGITVYAPDLDLLIMTRKTFSVQRLNHFLRSGHKRGIKAVVTIHANEIY